MEGIESKTPEEKYVRPVLDPSKIGANFLQRKGMKKAAQVRREKRKTQE